MKKEPKIPKQDETSNISPQEMQDEAIDVVVKNEGESQESVENNPRVEKDLSPEALLGKQLVDLEQALAETKDQLLRTAAEYDNFRKRTLREKEQLYADSVQDVVAVWLPLIDNLERAIHAVETVAGTNQDLVEGVKMIQKQAYTILEQLQVEEIAALGEVFDPNVHHAVMQIEDEAYGAQEIVEVFQKGYKRGDRVLRAAVVKVANC